MREKKNLQLGWTLSWDALRDPSRIDIEDEGETSTSDQALLNHDGRVLYDFPEKIPSFVKEEVKKVFKTLNPSRRRIRAQAIREAMMERFATDDSILGAIEEKLGSIAHEVAVQIAKDFPGGKVGNAYRAEDRVMGAAFHLLEGGTVVVEAGWKDFGDNPFVRVWAKIPEVRREFSQTLNFSTAFQVGTIGSKLGTYFRKNLGAWMDAL